MVLRCRCRVANVAVAVAAAEAGEIGETAGSRSTPQTSLSAASLLLPQAPVDCCYTSSSPSRDARPRLPARAAGRT